MTVDIASFEKTPPPKKKKKKRKKKKENGQLFLCIKWTIVLQRLNDAVCVLQFSHILGDAMVQENPFHSL